MKRLAALLGCVLLLCGTAAGCRNAPSSASSGDAPGGTTASVPLTDTLALAFNQEDTLDPFAATTQLNLYLSTLLFDSLVHLDEGFSPSPALAGSMEATDTTHLTVSLKAGAVFSDGSAVTAQDVVYSFERAKSSANYRALVSNVSGATARKNTVVFTLSTPDRDAGACLIFPIIKRGTGTDKPATAPIGSGPYVYSADTLSLTVNPRTGADPARFRTITLKTMVNSSEVLQNFESGNIHYFFDDLSDGVIPRTTGNDKVVDQNQLVFLGVNSAKPLLSSPDLRRAISLALDRTVIASSAYTGRARPATTPFHPLWKPAAGITAFSSGQNTEAAEICLKAALATPTPPTTAATDATAATTTTTTATTTTATTAPTESATVPVLTLLYPAGNSCREAATKLIVRQLALIDIPVTAVPVSYGDYLSRLAAGDYDLYLGEIRMNPNMNLQVFFTAGGAASFGVPIGNTAAQYTAFRKGEIAAADFVSAFSEEMPYIPICFKQGMAACHRSVSYITPSAYNVFDGILNWQ